jgi:MFS transporter, PAT family, beta-lactamase induction signal transducer AmpG
VPRVTGENRIAGDPRQGPHPVVWTILYLPFGALSGFVTVALTFLATKHGLSISEGALLNGANLLTQWLKWLWAPIVDVTLTPRKWYVLATAASAFGVLGMSIVPLGPSTLPLLLVIIAFASLINSAVGMAVEAILADATPPDQVGRVSAWFQAGNLGGNGLGGGLGLFLIVKLPQPWMAGAIMGALFMVCCFALLLTPKTEAGHRGEGAFAAVKGVVRDLKLMLKTKGGLLAAILCILPVGTGAAQPVLTQAEVAAFWGAGQRHVEILQGLLAGIITAAGCFAGGWVCNRLRPRIAYPCIGIGLAVIAVGMALSPATVNMYIAWSLVYAFGVGLSYAAFTAFVLEAMGKGSGATKYNIYASLANFPIWWLGLLLGVVAQRYGMRKMLLTEAVLGVLGVIVFATAVLRVRRSKLPEAVAGG